MRFLSKDRNDKINPTKLISNKLQQTKIFGVKFVYQSSKSIIMLKRFFILCSGVDSDIVNGCSNGEQNKYAGIGATVFFTAIMAFIAVVMLFLRFLTIRILPWVLG